MLEWIIILIMFLVGGLTVLQGAVNSALGKAIGEPMHAAIVSFATGLGVVSLVSLLFGRGLPAMSRVVAAPKFLLIGGTLGAIFVTAAIHFVPRVGVARVAVASICGQVIFSMLIDHYGLLGVPQQLIEPKRLIGGAFVIAGVLLINWR